LAAKSDIQPQYQSFEADASRAMRSSRESSRARSAASEPPETGDGWLAASGAPGDEGDEGGDWAAAGLAVAPSNRARRTMDRSDITALLVGVR
jgi:hypothetical protein